jgi:hypothetical protein
MAGPGTELPKVVKCVPRVRRTRRRLLFRQMGPRCATVNEAFRLGHEDIVVAESEISVAATSASQRPCQAANGLVLRIPATTGRFGTVRSGIALLPTGRCV